MSANVERWRDIVTNEVRSQGDVIPVGLALATIEAESTGNPRAYRGEAALNDGSIGLMQVLLGTARGMGYTGLAGSADTLSGLFDPATNIHYGVKFLTQLWRRLGSAADVASAYNGGVRPSLGFGSPVTKITTVCLARDSTGACIRTFTAQPGQYGNQPYVDKVLRLTTEYGDAQELPPVIIDGGDGTGGGLPPVVVVAGLAILGALLVGRKLL